MKGEIREEQNQRNQNNEVKQKNSLSHDLIKNKKLKIKESESAEYIYKKNNNDFRKKIENYSPKKESSKKEKRAFIDKNNNKSPLNSKSSLLKIINESENLKIEENIEQRKIYVDLNKKIDEKNGENEIINQRNLYCNNSIRTCQYTLITFLPLALLNQFKTAFNWFFLIYVIIACIPIISDKALAPEIAPFVIVLIISLIKEAIEDYRKYSNDKKLNNNPVLIYKDKRFYKEKCQNIKVGHIIKIYKEDLIPADVLIIKSSLKSGICYMQTSNLDGENALKPREAFNLTQKNIRNKSEIIKALFDYKDEYFYIEVKPPNKDIYDIEGTVFLDKKKNYITIKNILLRGARLKNVDYVYGIVLYSGHDTKLMQNIGHSSLKMSSIDKKLNYIILIIFIICIIINIISSVRGIISRDANMPNYDSGDINAEYLFYYRDKETRKNYLEIIRIVTNNFLIYNTFIPISIIISNAFCKILQTIYVQQFTPEYTKDKDDKIKCFSTGLLDELGNVKYIFSDKTGTLTKNEMAFRGCSIYTQLFDDSSNSNNESISNESYLAQSFLNLQFPPNSKNNFMSPSGKNISFNESTKMGTNFSKLSSSKISENFGLNNFLKFLQNNNNPPKNSMHIGGIPFNSTSEAIEHFFINIIINHDVLIETNSKGEIEFQGPSPDEKTLVTAAYEFGFRFVSRENGKILIEIYDQNGNKKEKIFKILQKFDFTSERQCSSIIVEDLYLKKIILYIKGSDNKIFSNLENYSLKNILPKTKAHADQFAKQGLRTLCYGFKYINQKDYKEWEDEYKEAKYKSLTNKELSGVVDYVINQIESKVILLGVSALEDKLQNEVEKDIKKFIEAGINFWMITGDKMDTAESIGYSCGIFSEDSEVYKIKDTNNVNKVINDMEIISKKIDKIDYELNNITKVHHEKMVKKKIIKNDENFIQYRKRYNSFNLQREEFNSITHKDKNEGKSMNVYHEILKINDEKGDKEKRNEEYKDSIFKNSNDINNYGPNNQMIKIDVNNSENIKEEQDEKNISPIRNIKKEEEKEEQKQKVKNEEPNINRRKKKSLTKVIKKTFEGSVNSHGSDKVIFKYVANKIENESNYEQASIIKNDVKNYEQSINSSEIFDQNYINHNMESSHELYNKEDQNEDLKSIRDDHKDNLENTKRRKKDIPLNEKDFHQYFDLCQKELYKCAIKYSQRFQLFKIKYLYPQPQENEYIYKKIKSKFSLMLEGSAISTCMKEGKAAELFWSLIQRSRSLICCRASPSQKSQIIEFIQKNTNSITLAIGDGGNDVNMIRTSHVGIGIFGKEGYQAAYNSDYAISQFKYLKRLLFYDGRITLAKNTYFLYHYFFKNFFFTLVLFWFGIYSCFSGGNYYDDYYSLGFNSFSTVIPLAVYEIIHQDFDPDFSTFNDKEKNLLKNLLPNVFKEYRDSLPFNLIKFISIFIFSIIFSYLCYIIPIYSFNNNFYGSDNSQGHQYCIWDTSFVSYISIIFSHYFIVFIDTNCFNPAIVICYLFQLIVTFIFLFFCDKANEDLEIYNSLTLMLSNSLTWWTIIMTCSFNLLLFFILRRAEFFFGGFIVNEIMQRNYKNYFIEKFYQKKVEQMTRVVRSVAKFKRIYYHSDEDILDDNLADQKMRKIVDDYKFKKKNTIRKNKSNLK